jgi:hypothetical protein
VNLICHNLQVFVILCTIISILLKSTKVLYHPETCRVSEVPELLSEAAAHPRRRGGERLPGCSPHSNGNFKNIDFVDTIISTFFFSFTLQPKSTTSID